MKQITEGSPRFKARMAGGFFFLTMLTAAFTELVALRRLNFAADIAAGIVELSGMVAVTLLFYFIFKPVNRSLSFLAAFFNLAGLTLEALQVLNIGLVFHGLFCLLIGTLIFRSTFLPRILGAPMAIAGLCFLTFLSPTFANYQPPYNLFAGLAGEGLVMLWLLAMGVNAQRWNAQANASAIREHK